MTRLMVFLGVLTGFILILVLFTFKSAPVSNEKFDLHKVETEYKNKQAEIAAATAPKEHTATAEVEFVEYAPVVDLSTPALQAGSKIYSQCIACHGKGGEGKASQKAPLIGGQYAWYIEKQLVDMKSGDRINVAMAPIVKGLSPEDMKNVAAYVEALPWDKEKYLNDLKAAQQK